MAIILFGFLEDFCSFEIQYQPDKMIKYVPKIRLIASLACCMLASAMAHAQVFFSENFNGAAIPNGWTVTDGGSTAETWKIQAPFIYGTTPDTLEMVGTNFLFSNGDINGSGSSTNERIESPVISATGATALILSFDHYFRRAGETFADSGVVEIYNGTQWVKLGAFSATVGSGKAPVEAKFPITQYNNAQLKVRFIHKGNWPWYWAIDNVKVYTPSATDVGVSDILLPGGCALPASVPVTIEIINYGSAPQSNIPVRYQVNGQTPVQETYSGTLAVNDTVQYTFTTQASASASGTYIFSAWTRLAGDGDATNDTTAGIRGTRAPAILAPIGFQGFLGENLNAVHPGWTEGTGDVPSTGASTWYIPTAEQITALGSATAKLNLYTTDNKAWLVSPPVTPSTGAVIRFKMALTSFNDITADEMGSDDSLIVKVSANCGQTWQLIKTFTVTDQLTNQLTTYIVPLTAFQGQTIRFAFYGTDGTENDDPDYDIHIDEVEVLVPSPTDVGVISLGLPSADCGIPASFSLTARIYNNGNATQTGFPVSYKLDNQSPVTENFTGSLAPGAFANFTFAAPIAIATPGDHFISAWTSLTGDNNALNDSVRNVKVTKPGSVLPLNNFQLYNGDNITTAYPGWREANGLPLTGTTSSWLTNSATQQDSLGTITAKVNLYSDFKREWLISPAVIPAAGTVLKYKVAVTSWGEPIADEMGTDDSVSVLVSANCGTSWTRLVSYTKADNLINRLVDKTLPLSQFAGQSIIIAFYGTDGTVDDDQDYDFHIDDVQVLLPANADIGVSQFVLPDLNCGIPNALPLVARVFNYGAQAQSNFDVSYSLNGSSATTQAFTGTLNPGGFADVAFTAPLDLTNAGSYFISAWTTLNGDADGSNDSLKNVKIVKSAGTLPLVNFNNYTGTNLAAVAEGWREQKGIAPAGAVSEWTSNSATQSTLFGGTTAKINLISDTKREWLISPVFGVDQNTFVKFKTAVTTYNQTGSATMGSDDSVNVMVSTNCGANWTRLQAFTAASGLTNQLSQQSVSLQAYAGQNVLVAFFATEGEVNDINNYDFHIDDIDVSPFTNTSEAYVALDANLYPNPAHDFVTLATPAAVQPGDHLLISTLDGRKVWEGSGVQIAENMLRIDVSTFQTGLYVVSGSLCGKPVRSRLSVIRK